MKLSIEDLKELRGLCIDSTVWPVILDELIAIRELKGEQVPVAFTAARWLDTRCKVSVWTDRESAALGVGDNSRLIELFTAPQKLVVLQRKVEAKFIDDFERGCIQGYNDAIDDVEAAGGVVNGGE